MAGADAYLEESLASLARAHAVVLADGVVATHGTQQTVADLKRGLLLQLPASCYIAAVWGRRLRSQRCWWRGGQRSTELEVTAAKYTQNVYLKLGERISGNSVEILVYKTSFIIFKCSLKYLQV